MEPLPEPEVMRCSFDEGFQPHLPVLCLSWDPMAMGFIDRIWELPEGVSILGPAPERFGLSFERRGADSYAVRLVLNQTRLSWSSLSRVQLLTSALLPLLNALKTELRNLLEQPVKPEGLRKAA
jgi:hypothetical protein